MPVCTRCHKEKPVEDFGKRPTNKSGIDCMCRDCRNRIKRNRTPALDNRTALRKGLEKAGAYMPLRALKHLFKRGQS